MDSSKLKLEISLWIKNCISEQNKKAILLSIEDNSIYSVLNYFFCKGTGLPVHAIIKKTEKLYSYNFCLNNNIPYSIFNNYINKDDLLININYPGMNRISYIENIDKLNESQYIAFISYVADTTNSLYSGNLTRNDYYFIRNFPKVNTYDILPFVNLSESKLLELIKIYNLESVFSSVKDIIDNTPNPNLDLEWLYSANFKSKLKSNKLIGIIDSKEDPTKDKNWFSFTVDQKKLIAKTHQIEKITKDRIINGSIFKIEENH